MDSLANRVAQRYAASRRFEVYENPDTSEVSGEYDTLAKALKHKPVPNAEIILNGVTVAEVKNRKWILTSYGKTL